MSSVDRSTTKRGKIWSMNSPFEVAVFSTDKAERWVRAGRARILPLDQAMAIITENFNPKKWSVGWMRKKFASMGMPRSCGDQVLVFTGEFAVRVHNQAVEQIREKMVDQNFEQMVDDGRRPDDNSKRGVGVWTSRPSQPSKTAGAPVQKVRSMRIVFPR